MHAKLTACGGKILLAALAAVVCASLLAGCSVEQDPQEQQAAEPIETLADLQGKRVGTLTGSACIPYAEQYAGSEGTVAAYNTIADTILALESGKCDACILDGPLARWSCATYDDQVMLDEPVAPISYAALFSKTSDRGRELRDEYNEFLAGIKADGTFDELQVFWMDDIDDGDHTVDFENLPAVNGTLKAATYSGIGAPIVYVQDGKITGYDIDLLTRFCKERGYALELSDVDFTGILAAVASGKYEMAICGITVTPERAENFLFSDDTYTGSMVAVTKVAGAQDVVPFFGDIANSFKRTFIDEDRWQLFARGIGVTLLITVMSLLLGTLLGFGVYLLCRNGGRVINRIIDFFVWLISDMPTVVFVMILFYVVFGHSPIPDVAVAIVGFTLIFAASVMGMLRNGVEAVDKGQQEAAQALGYSRNRTFLKIILPQAIRHILPTYKSELVALLKGTAVVGYIAVQDLTKMGDIVRSRTYEAFFPLIAVAIIYLILAALLKAAVNALISCINRSSRDAAKILKGVDTDDRA